MDASRRACQIHTLQGQLFPISKMQFEDGLTEVEVVQDKMSAQARKGVGMIGMRLGGGAE
eukprot:1144271-Pelagomonas_calceolata.AAC.2